MTVMSLECVARLTSKGGPPPGAVTRLLRKHETINGRPYLIEMLPVSRDRWRAQLARKTGSTALMPFYATTPDLAVTRLTEWLSLAHKRAAGAGAP